MVITGIERMRSRQPRYRVRFDEGDPLVLTEDLLLRYGLARGDEFSTSALEKMREESERDSAKQKAYQYISYRPRSEYELISHLRRKGISKRHAQWASDELKRIGLVDDGEVAGMIVRDALTRGRSGPAAVRSKLLEKRISRQIIDGLIEEHFTEAVLSEKAEVLLRKRLERTGRRLQTLEPAKRRARLYQYLLQRGFSSRTATRALKSIEV